MRVAVLMEASLPESALAQGAALLSEVHLQLGDLEAAAAAAAEAMSASSSPEWNYFRTQALTAQLDIAQQFGRYPEARAALESIMEIHRSAGSEWHEVWYEIRVAYLELLAGETLESWARCASALPKVLALGDPDLLVGLAENAVLALDAGRADAAARAHGSMSSFRKLHGLPVSKATSDLLDADAGRYRSNTGEEAWDEGVRRGLDEPLEEILPELLLLPAEEDRG